MDQDETIRELLRTTRTIAIVGLSPDDHKPSNTVARYLKDQGLRIFPVYPGQASILGETAYASVSEIPEQVDIVDIFMRADKVLSVVEEAIRLRPKAIWLQLGIVNEEAKEVVEKSGITFVMDKCIEQEYERLSS
jgi:uncharacterized protein